MTGVIITEVKSDSIDPTDYPVDHWEAGRLERLHDLNLRQKGYLRKPLTQPFES